MADVEELIKKFGTMGNVIRGNVGNNATIIAESSTAEGVTFNHIKGDVDDNAEIIAEGDGRVNITLGNVGKDAKVKATCQQHNRDDATEQGDDFTFNYANFNAPAVMKATHVTQHFYASAPVPGQEANAVVTETTTVQDTTVGEEETTDGASASTPPTDQTVGTNVIDINEEEEPSSVTAPRSEPDGGESECDVYISYETSIREKVLALMECLQKEGYNCSSTGWTDDDKCDFRTRKAGRCIMISCITPNYFDCDTTMNEVSEAIERKMKIIPLIFEKTKPWPPAGNNGKYFADLVEMKMRFSNGKIDENVMKKLLNYVATMQK